VTPPEAVHTKVMGETLAMTELTELQRLMEATYGKRDRARGIPATVAWLAEEMGELAKAVRKGGRDDQVHELGDTLAWLASLANQLDISLDEAVHRYEAGCPRCDSTPCVCEA
jgi:NTP pyrophosphatase (non-canonical NTP hydrolase)